MLVLCYDDDSFILSFNGCDGDDVLYFCGSKFDCSVRFRDYVNDVFNFRSSDGYDVVPFRISDSDNVGNLMGREGDYFVHFMDGLMLMFFLMVIIIVLVPIPRLIEHFDKWIQIFWLVCCHWRGQNFSGMLYGWYSIKDYPFSLYEFT